jgi:SAM-dependent methyltransferase
MRAWHFIYKNISAVNDIYHAKAECRILDLGCSTGYFRRILEGNFNPEDKKNLYYWGVDVREGALREAVTGTDDIESGATGDYIPSAFIVHDFKDPLPFKDNFFDYIVSFEAIKYLPVAQGRALLKEINRVCKTTGKLFLSTSYTVDKPGFMQTVPFEEIEHMIEESGFTFLQKKGSQATLQGLSKFLKKDHLPLINDLLKVHPPEMVAAMVTPLYPQCASQVTFWCSKKVKVEESKELFKLRDD